MQSSHRAATRQVMLGRGHQIQCKLELVEKDSVVLAGEKGIIIIKIADCCISKKEISTISKPDLKKNLKIGF